VIGLQWKVRNFRPLPTVLLIINHHHRLVEIPRMAVFPSRPVKPSSLNQTVRRNPALFGVPFVLLMVVASYGLSTVTQTRYDLHDQKVKHVRLFLLLLEKSRLCRVLIGPGDERTRTQAGQESQEVRYT
jgi:hypothetical protein